MSDMLGISSTAVAAYQRALSTVSNNIANVSTDGYSRQQVGLESNAPAKSANHYMGTGVLFKTVKRQFDAFAESNLRNSTSDLQTQGPLVEYTQRLMDIMGDKSVGLSSALDTFFESARSLSVDPASTVMRSSFLRGADGLASRFAELSGQMTLIAEETRQAMESAAGQLNTLTDQLALVNQQLSKTPVLENQPSELLDRRDLLLRQISEFSRIKTSFTSNGIVSVSLGGTMKQSLVVDGLKARPIGFDPNAVNQLDMVLDPYGMTEPLSGTSGGKIGGFNTFISQVLEPAQKSLDFLAKTFVDEVNGIQRDGIDGYGQVGMDLYKIDPAASNTASGLRVVLTDGMRIATGAQFRVTENVNNASDVRAKVSYVKGDDPVGVSNPNLVNNPNPSAGVPVQVGGARDYALVTQVAAGVDSPTFYLDNVQPGQQLQVLTKDGRQLIGRSLTIDEQYQMLTPENGFTDPVTFNDKYLNQYGEKGYLGADIFYGAKAKVLYEQQFDKYGNPAQSTPLPAVLQSGRLNMGQTGTVVAAGAIQLNGQPLGALVASGATLVAKDVANWINNAGQSDVVASAYNEIRVPAKSLDYRLGLTLNGTTIGVVQPGMLEPTEYHDLTSLVSAIQAKSELTGVTARVSDNGDLVLENAVGHEGDNISLGPADSGGRPANALAMTAQVYAGQVRIERALGVDPSKSDIRLSFGANGTPADLSRAGFRTGAYIEGKVPDDLLVFVTGEGKSTVAASYSGAPADPQAKLRTQSLVIKFTAPDHYTIVDKKTGTELASRNYDPTVLDPVIAYQGLRVQFTRAPNAGDVYTVDGNNDGIGNNENMLVMADLAKKDVISGKTFADQYIDQVNTVGNTAQQAKITQQALTVVFEQAQSSRDKVSGVNLDDEAADLIRYQQAYQAAAKAMQVSGQLFDAIVQAS